MTVLDSISDPANLAALPADQLPALAAEIRAVLVQTCAVTGGHLGANLGVVELTIALHRVFRSPYDAIVWDTGHQAYVHKLLTGRRAAFAGLRQAGGLSGYPSRHESPHDVIENSHASAGLSWAAGIAAGRRALGHAGTVVAVVGDGALTGGMAYEALNNIGVRAEPVVVVLNDNGRSYAPTVSRALRDPTPFFDALGLAYVGPVDGHDVAALEEALRHARALDGPVVVHARTVKGFGYPPAERDEEKRWHDVGPFDPATGVKVPAAGPSFTDVFADALVRGAEAHPELVAITAAMPGSTGVLAMQRRFPSRVIDVGIAEQHAVTYAAGLAMAGLRPVVAIYSTFLNRAWDQLCYDVGLHRLPVVLCVDRAGITGDDGPSHHGVYDLALLSKIPGMVVLAPSCADELAAMLETALDLPGPVAIRWPKGAARPSVDGAVGVGVRARRLAAGDDVCILAVGRMVGPALEAAALLSADGVTATVWDVRAVAPLDDRMLADAARHPLVVSVEDGVADGGAGTAIASALAARGRGGTAADVLTLGTPRRYLPHGRAESMLAQLGLDGPGITAAVAAALPSPGRALVTHGR